MHKYTIPRFRPILSKSKQKIKKASEARQKETKTREKKQGTAASEKKVLRSD